MMHACGRMARRGQERDAGNQRHDDGSVCGPMPASWTGSASFRPEFQVGQGSEWTQGGILDSRTACKGLSRKRLVSVSQTRCPMSDWAGTSEGRVSQPKPETRSVR